MVNNRQPKDRISISLSADVKRSLERIAEKNQISIARVVRQAITDFLNNRDREHFLFNSEAPSGDGLH